MRNVYSYFTVENQLLPAVLTIGQRYIHYIRIPSMPWRLKGMRRQLSGTVGYTSWADYINQFM
jgi:electron transfer flavoprotein alpha/beta subunit